MMIDPLRRRRGGIPQGGGDSTPSSAGAGRPGGLDLGTRRPGGSRRIAVPARAAGWRPHTVVVEQAQRLEEKHDPTAAIARREATLARTWRRRRAMPSPTASPTCCASPNCMHKPFSPSKPRTPYKKPWRPTSLRGLSNSGVFAVPWVYASSCAEDPYGSAGRQRHAA